MAITLSLPSSFAGSIPVSGSLGPAPTNVQGSANRVQNTATTSNQYLGGNIPSPTAAPKSAPAVDPYAGTVFGSTAGYNKAISDFNNQKNSTLSSITNAIGSNAGDFGGSIQDYLDQRKQSQNQINSDATQNELAREQGMQGVLDMVGNGIKSGGVTLANSNAGTSSAGEALARAYGILGRQQASSVGNQAAQGQNKVNTEENNLLAGDATETRHVSQSKTDTINNIVNSARQQLANLNYYAASASVPDRVDIEHQIAQVKQQAIDALSQYDGTLAQGTAGQPANSAAQTRAAAQGLLTAGVAPENQFNYTTSAPAQFQNTGQFASDLPIFVAPNKNNNQT